MTITASRRTREPRPHINAPEAVAPFNYSEVLELIRQILREWPLFKDAHLSKEQITEEYRANRHARQANAIALAQQGDFRVLGDMLWREEDLSPEARWLMREWCYGRARSTRERNALGRLRTGPAKGKQLSSSRRAAQWVPAIEQILDEFYPQLSDPERTKWAPRLAADHSGIKRKIFLGFWKRKKHPPSAIDDLDRFRNFVCWWRSIGARPVYRWWEDEASNEQISLADYRRSYRKYLGLAPQLFDE
jgi:hypothetical protein